jgi:hypothetical protein
MKVQVDVPLKHMEQYEKLFSNKTEFFSTYNPVMIEEALVENLQKIGVEVKRNDAKYKFKFVMTSKDQSGAVQ